MAIRAQAAMRLCLALLFVAGAMAAKPANVKELIERSYIVGDVGSGGTRFNLYVDGKSWNGPKGGRCSGEDAIDGGLAVTIPNHPDGNMGNTAMAKLMKLAPDKRTAYLRALFNLNYLVRCVDYVEQSKFSNENKALLGFTLSQADIKTWIRSVQTYLHATAGVRLGENSQKRDENTKGWNAVMDAADYVRRHDENGKEIAGIPKNRMVASCIAGTVEGYLGFLGTSAAIAKAKAKKIDGGFSDYIFMEVGGASAQVAFTVADGQTCSGDAACKSKFLNRDSMKGKEPAFAELGNALKAKTMTMGYFSLKYPTKGPGPMFIHSFLGNGLNRFTLHTLFAALKGTAKTEKEIKVPCFATGANLQTDANGEEVCWSPNKKRFQDKICEDFSDKTLGRTNEVKALLANKRPIVGKINDAQCETLVNDIVNSHPDETNSAPNNIPMGLSYKKQFDFINHALKAAGPKRALVVTQGGLKAMVGKFQHKDKDACDDPSKCMISEATMQQVLSYACKVGDHTDATKGPDAVDKWSFANCMTAKFFKNAFANILAGVTLDPNFKFIVTSVEWTDGASLVYADVNQKKDTTFRLKAFAADVIANEFQDDPPKSHSPPSKSGADTGLQSNTKGKKK